MEDGRRYRFLEDSPAVAQHGWLPPADEVPELGDLRADHDRLLDAIATAEKFAGDARRQRAAELEAQRAAHEAAFLGVASGEVPPLTVTEDQVAQAAARAQAAWDALQTFARSAVDTIRTREAELHERLDATVAAAETKRIAAEAMLRDADAMEASTRRLCAWLGRAAERSSLGHYPYEQMSAPDPEGGANGRMTVADLHRAQNPEVVFVDESAGAFGTDDPNNLDTDERPWEQQLAEEVLTHGH